MVFVGIQTNYVQHQTMKGKGPLLNSFINSHTRFETICILK